MWGWKTSVLLSVKHHTWQLQENVLGQKSRFRISKTKTLPRTLSLVLRKQKSAIGKTKRVWYFYPRFSNKPLSVLHFLKQRIFRCFDGECATTKFIFILLFSSDAWRRPRNNGKLQMDNKKDMFPDEIPERAKSCSFDVPLEDEKEEYDIHPKHAPV